MKRFIDEIIIHCSASPARTKMVDIRAWHKEKGWKDIGYHIVIEQSGLIKHGRDKDVVGAHCEGHNAHSLGICLIGGLQANGSMVNFTKEQFISLKMTIEGIFLTYGKLPIVPHHKYNKGKSCPNIDIEEWVKDGMPASPSAYIMKKWSK